MRIQYFSMSQLLFLISFFLIALSQTHKAEWLNHGGDLSNTRSRTHGEPTIRRSLLRNLRLRWEFYVGNDVTATPALSDGVVYFPAWDGNLYAVRAHDGGLVWRLNLTQLTGVGGLNGTTQTISRATPVVAGRLLLVGIYGPAVVVAIDRWTGVRVWMTRLDPRPLAQITMSGTAFLE